MDALVRSRCSGHQWHAGLPLLTDDGVVDLGRFFFLLLLLPCCKLQWQQPIELGVQQLLAASTRRRTSSARAQLQ